jgi:chromatin remodeling complex protein RSC6
MATKKKAKAKTKRKPNPAFMKAMKPSAALAEIVGAKPLPRTEVIKKLWQYIKRHNLQDKKNRRAINADDKLTPLFKKKQVTMFELAKIANKNLS